MRPETAEAFARLVSTYVTVIEATDTILPNDIEQRLAENPLKACELLNELALSSDALDPETDAIVAAIYESMDARDARGEVDEATRSLISRAFSRAHHERPKPEPAPIAEAVHEAEDDTAEQGAEARDEEKPKPTRKRSRRAKAEAREVTEPVAEEGIGREGTTNTEGAEANAATSHAQAAPDADEASRGEHAASEGEAERPRKRRARKPRAQKTEDAPKTPESETASVIAPAQVSASAGAPSDAPSSPAPAAADTAQETGARQAAASEPSEAPEAPAANATDATSAAKKTKRPSTRKKAHEEAPAPKPEMPLADPATIGDVLTVDQTLAALGVSRPTVYKLIENGKLPAYKKGRSWQISAAAVAELSQK